MAPPLSASFITISLMEDRSLRAVCREVRSSIVRYAQYKFVVVCSSAVYKRVNKVISSVRRCVSVVVFLFAFTAGTPLRRDTGVFESFGRFIIVLLD